MAARSVVGMVAGSVWTFSYSAVVWADGAVGSGSVISGKSDNGKIFHLGAADDKAIHKQQKL